MRFATSDEMEYLGKVQGATADPCLIHEMAQRLEALRRFDQSFSEADYRPPAGESSRAGFPARPR